MAPSFTQKGGLRFLLQVLLWAVVIAVNQVFLNDDGNIPLEWYLPTSIRILGGLVGMIGVGLTAGSIYAFVRIDQVPNVFPLPAPGCPLITTGVYSFMRHPGYVGNVSLFIAGSLSLGCGYGVLSAVLLLCHLLLPQSSTRGGLPRRKIWRRVVRVQVSCALTFLPYTHPLSWLAVGGGGRGCRDRC